MIYSLLLIVMGCLVRGGVKHFIVKRFRSKALTVTADDSKFGGHWRTNKDVAHLAQSAQILARARLDLTTSDNIKESQMAKPSRAELKLIKQTVEQLFSKYGSPPSGDEIFELSEALADLSLKFLNHEIFDLFSGLRKELFENYLKGAMSNGATDQALRALVEENCLQELLIRGQFMGLKTQELMKSPDWGVAAIEYCIQEFESIQLAISANSSPRARMVEARYAEALKSLKVERLARIMAS